MGHFATFSHVENDLRTAVRIADEGTVTLLVTRGRGEIVRSIDANIDRLRAADIVADALMMAPGLPDSAGELSFGVGEGSGAPHIRSFRRDQMPADAFNVERRIREVCDDVVNGEPPPVAPTRSSGSAFSAVQFATWTGLFMVGHVFAGIAGLLALGLLTSALGLMGLIGGFVLLLALIGATYTLLGRQFGLLYPREDAWKPAMAALVIPSLLSLLAGGGGSIGLSFIFPLLASFGASTAR